MQSARNVQRPGEKKAEFCYFSNMVFFPPLYVVCLGYSCSETVWRAIGSATQQWPQEVVVLVLAL